MASLLDKAKIKELFCKTTPDIVVNDGPLTLNYFLVDTSVCILLSKKTYSIKKIIDHYYLIAYYLLYILY